MNINYQFPEVKPRYHAVDERTRIEPQKIMFFKRNLQKEPLSFYFVLPSSLSERRFGGKFEVVLAGFRSSSSVRHLKKHYNRSHQIDKKGSHIVLHQACS